VPTPTAWAAQLGGIPIDAGLLVQISIIGGGFAFAAAALLLVMRALFDAVRKGELVARSVHDAQILQLTTENAALRRDLRDAARELGRLADAGEDQARALRETLVELARLRQ
jgi:hypothetical protein